MSNCAILGWFSPVHATPFTEVLRAIHIWTRSPRRVANVSRILQYKQLRFHEPGFNRRRHAIGPSRPH